MLFRSTSGGVVPKGNPDRIESSSASKYGEYSIEGFDDLTSETHETAHGGYDPVYCNEDSDRVLPVDVLREMEKNGRIGKLHEFFYTTTGNGTAVLYSVAFAKEFSQKLLAAGVDAVGIFIPGLSSYSPTYLIICSAHKLYEHTVFCFHKHK